MKNWAVLAGLRRLARSFVSGMHDGGLCAYLGRSATSQCTAQHPRSRDRQSADSTAKRRDWINMRRVLPWVNLAAVVVLGWVPPDPLRQGYRSRTSVRKRAAIASSATMLPLVFQVVLPS